MQMVQRLPCPQREALWVSRLICCCCCCYPKQTTIIIIIWFKALQTFNHLFFCVECIFGALIAKLLAFIAAMFGNWNKLSQLAKSCEIYKLIQWQLRPQKIRVLCEIERYKILSDPFERMRFCRWRHAANKMFIFAHDKTTKMTSKFLNWNSKCASSPKYCIMKIYSYLRVVFLHIKI